MQEIISVVASSGLVPILLSRSGMPRMMLPAIGAVLGVGLALVASSSSSSSSGECEPDPPFPPEPPSPPPLLPPTPPNAPTSGGGWLDIDAPRRIRALARRVIEVTGWHGFDDYLVAVSWTESRGDPQAGSSAADNAARGWFGIRPRSGLAYQLEELAESSPNLLKEERWAVALAAWYGSRLRGYAFSGQTIDWLALRRGWALPRLVADVDEVAEVKNYLPGERSADVRRRFTTAVAKVGLDESFMYEPAFPAGFHWPGLEVVLRAVGLSPVVA